MSNASINGDQDIRDAFFDALYDIAREDRQVIFLTADMGARSLERFRKGLPKQYMNVGVAEQNMVSVAAGLALAGKRVFIYAIAPFATQRCYEQIKVDLSGMGLPVTVIGAGPGVAYHSDGPTHHASPGYRPHAGTPRHGDPEPFGCGDGLPSSEALVPKQIPGLRETR